MAVAAQRYAGYFTGHPYTFDQQSQYQIVPPGSNKKGIHVSKKKWTEPTVIADDCQFCVRLTDESAESRVAGYQHQLDIEILRSKVHFYRNWLEECGPNVVDKIETEEGGKKRQYGVEPSAANRRAFLAAEQDRPRITRLGLERNDGWTLKSLPIVDLPLKLKRKLCIEWNHIYTDFLKENPTVEYDFERKEFYRNMPNLEPAECCEGPRNYAYDGLIITLHNEGCSFVEPPKVPSEINEAAWIAAMGGHFA
jgi:hypothetical protein